MPNKTDRRKMRVMLSDNIKNSKISKVKLPLVKLPLILIILFALLGLIVFIKYYDTAFPLASISFKVDREKAAPIAAGYLNDLGYSVEGFETTTVFSYHRDAKEYLEKHLPLEEANLYMGKDVPVWFWYVRFFKYSQQEEYQVLVEPSGRVISFKRVISEDLPMDSLTMEEGREAALSFLSSQGIDISKLELAEQGGTQQKGRTDRSYSFKDKNISAAGAFVHYNVHFQGNEPGYYSAYLYVPQDMKIQWRDERQKGKTLVQAANLLLIFLILGIIYYVYKNGVIFRRKLALYLAGAIVIVVLLEQTNSLPLSLSQYVTNIARGSYWMGIWIGIIMSAAVYGIMTFFTASLGTSLSEKEFTKERPIAALGGSKIPLYIFIGYASAFIILGYDVIFYLAGKNFGIWTPMHIPYDNILSTPLPWVNALFVGFSAAVLEELFFRMCAITYLSRITNNKFIILIVPAVIWAALHCNYPQEPFYIRGIELTFVGIFLGWLYMRYGILSVIVSHYAINAIYGSMLLMKSGSPYLVTSGYITAGLLLIPAAAAVLMRKRLKKIEDEAEKEKALLREIQEQARQQKDDEEDLHTGAFSISYTKMQEPVKILFFRLSPKMKGVMFLLALGGILGEVFFSPPSLGGGEKLTLSPSEAKHNAAQYLNSLGVDVSKSKTGSKLSPYLNMTESRYIAQKLGIKDADEHIRRFLPPYICLQKFSFDRENIAYQIKMDSSGNVISYYKEVPESKTGKKLDKEQAKTLADDYISRFSGSFVYQDFKQAEHPHRTDYTFIYRQEEGDVEDAKLMATVLVQGDEPMGFHRYFEVPGSFRRSLNERGLKDGIAITFLALTAVGFFFWTIIYSIKRKLKGEINIKIGLYTAIPVVVLTLISRLNSFENIWFTIPYYEPFTRYILNWIMETVSLSLSLGMLALYITTVIESASRDLFPHLLPAAEWFKAACSPVLSGKVIRRGVIAGYSFIFFIAFPLTTLLFDDKTLTYLGSYPLWKDLPSVSSYLPALQLFCSSIVEGFIGAGIMALFFFFTLKVTKRILPALIVIFLCIVSFSVITVQTGAPWFVLLKLVISLTLQTAMILLFIKFFFKDNLFAYLTAALFGIMLRDAFNLLEAGGSFYVINGAVLMITALIPLLWCIWTIFFPIKKNIRENTP